MAIKGGCGRSECCASTGIDDNPTFGTGKLDENGFWEFPCNACLNADRKFRAEERARKNTVLRMTVNRINLSSGVSRLDPPCAAVMNDQIVFLLPKELSERQIESLLLDLIGRCRTHFGVKV